MRNKQLCAPILMILAVGIILLLAFTPSETSNEAVPCPPDAEKLRSQMLATQSLRLQEFLESKQSPLAPDAEFVIGLKHWKLLVAISAIESQYCKHQLGYNCWGIGGDTSYRYYSSFRAAATDANDLIESWQVKGKWLTVEEMNCSYVQPCNPNWVKVVNDNLQILNEITKE